MDCFTLKEREYLYEHVPEVLDKEGAFNTLFTYLHNQNKPTLGCKSTGNFVEDLLMNYMKLKGTKNGRILEQSMIECGFDYSMSIHNAIYYMLAQKRELEKDKIKDIKPTDWPGVKSYHNNQEVYIINTIYGNITVSKASEIFKDTKSNYIFKKELMQKCWNRSYDFAKENPDYTIVLSYLPNFFSSGHYHAYLEKGSTTLDIASNGLYESKNDSKKVLNGEIIKKLSFEEAEETYQKVTEKINNKKLIKEYAKLHLLSLYYKNK